MRSKPPRSAPAATVSVGWSLRIPTTRPTTFPSCDWSLPPTPEEQWKPCSSSGTRTIAVRWRMPDRPTTETVPSQLTVAEVHAEFEKLLKDRTHMGVRNFLGDAFLESR